MAISFQYFIFSLLLIYVIAKMYPTKKKPTTPAFYQVILVQHHLFIIYLDANQNEKSYCRLKIFYLFSTRKSPTFRPFQEITFEILSIPNIRTLHDNSICKWTHVKLNSIFTLTQKPVRNLYGQI